MGGGAESRIVETDCLKFIVQAHPLAPGVVAAVASGGGGGGFQAGHSRLKKHDEV